MSEGLTETTTTTSAPEAPVSTTSDIAASVIQTAEAQDAPTDGAHESYATAADTTADTPTAPVAEVKLSPAAEFLVKQGHKWGKRPDGKTDLAWLPASTVEKMLDRYVETHKATWDGERTTLAQQAAEARQHLDALRAAVTGDEVAFLQELAQVNPRFRRFLEAQPQTPTARPSPQAEMPQPDITLPDGGKTYSVEGLQKLIEWGVTAKALPQIEEKLKPLSEWEQQRQYQQFEDQARARTSRSLQEAQSWPEFGTLAADGTLSPFQQEVLAELQKDSEAAAKAGMRPQMTLRQAYLEVRGRRQTPEAVREQVLKQLQTAPKAPSLARTGVEATRPVGPKSSADIARQIIAQAEG